MPVYIIRAGDTDMVKIGYARADNLLARLISLQCSNHERLIILRVMDGDRSLERALHSRFDHLRVHSEWFRFDRAMLDDLGAPDRVGAPTTIPMPSKNSGWSDERRTTFSRQMRDAWRARRIRQDDAARKAA